MKPFLLVVALLVAVPAWAQESKKSAPSLKLPTIVFASAAAADWATTYNFLDDKILIEANPSLAVARNRPLATIATGAVLDVVGAWAWNRFVGKRHPKMATVGLYLMAGFRTGLAIDNWHDNVRATALQRNAVNAARDVRDDICALAHC